MEATSTIEASWAQVVKRPGMIRSEVSLQGLTAVDAWDGKEGWSVQPFQGRREPERTSPDDAKEMARDADLDGPLVDWREKGHRVEYLGTEDVDGTPAHKLRVTLKDGDTQYVYLDPDSFLEIRVVTESHVRGVEQVDRDRPRRLRAGRAASGFPSRSSPAPGAARGGNASRSSGPSPTSRRTTRSFHFPAKGAAVGRAILAGPAVRAAAAPPARPRPAHAPVLDAGVISGLGARNIGSATMSGRISAVAAPQRGRQDDALRRRGQRRRLEVARRRHDLQAGVRQEDGAVDRRDRHRPAPTRRRSGSAPASRGRATRCRSATASTSRPTAARPGPTWASPSRSAIVAHRRRPGQRATSSTPACPGKLWSDSADRGVYKTADGGKTWTLVLKGANLSTGCSGLAMDPKNPDVLLRRHCGTSAARAGPSAPAATARTAPSGSGLFRIGRRRRDLDELTTPANAAACRPSPGAASRSRSRRPTRRSSTRSSSRRTRRSTAPRDGGAHLGGARQQPDDGLAAVLLRAPHRRPDEPRPRLQARLRPDRQRGRRQELLLQRRAARTATGTTSGSTPTTRST